MRIKTILSTDTSHWRALDTFVSFRSTLYDTLESIRTRYRSLPRFSLAVGDIKHHRRGQTYEDGSHLTHAVLIREDRQRRPRFKLPVTSTLYAALQNLRGSSISGSNSEKLWADAVCINQNEILERNQQVAIMALIYQNSNRLNIWLADMDLPWCMAQRSITWQVVFYMKNILGQNIKRAAVEHILQHPWLRRRWVIQEVLHTRVEDRYFWLGALQVSWNTFIAVVKDAQIESLSLRPILTDAVSVHDPESMKRPLLSNLWLWDQPDCQDPRDRLYALLSISKDIWSFNVDYGKYTESVYLQLARRIIDCNVSYDISVLLACALMRSNRELSPMLPSWAPNWRLPRRFNPQELEDALSSLSKPPGQEMLFCSRVFQMKDIPYLGLIGWLLAGRKDGLNDFSRQIGFYPEMLMFGENGRPPIYDNQALLLFPGSQFAFILLNCGKDPSRGVDIYQLDSFVPLFDCRYFLVKQWADNFGLETTEVYIA